MFFKKSSENPVNPNPQLSDIVARETSKVLQNVKDFSKNLISRPDHIKEKHWKELVEGSFIDPGIAALNFRSVAGEEASNLLLYSALLPRTNPGVLTSYYLKRYGHLNKGGWYCPTLNILNDEISLWGCLKPDHPYTGEDDKPIKYEHPPKVNTGVFFLKVAAKQWWLISQRFDKPLPENYQELPPEAFWHWVREYNLSIIICEGAKKAAALLSCGYVAIGLPGIWSGYRSPKNENGERDGQPYLLPELKFFANPDRTVYFCFDQDNKRQTVKSVNAAIEKTSKLLVKNGCTVKVLSWCNALGKGIDDVIVNEGTREIFDEIYRNGQDLAKWSAKKLKQLTYEPNVVLNDRYLPKDLRIPAGKQLIALISPKGTGKTTFLISLLNPLLATGERRILVITHRDQLGRELASKFGIPYVDDTDSDNKRFGIGLCIDSLRPNSQAKFNPNDWKGAYVVLDEIQQLIWHLLSSSTCKSDRVEIFKNFRELLRTVISTGGKILIADADLRDDSIDFIKGLVEGIEPYIIENTFKFNEPWTVYNFLDKTPGRLLAEAEKQLREGKKILFCLSGQKAKSKWGSTVLEQYFKKLFPDLKILRIDSQTVANPGHPSCGVIERLNDEVSNYDLVIATPTIETGVSIEVKHFDAVFGIFYGVQTTDSVRQHLSRYRHPVPRYLWASNTGCNWEGNGSNDVSALLKAESKKDKYHRQCLNSIGFDESLDGNGLENIFLITWAKNAAIKNNGMRHYREQIISDLKDEGHIIVDSKPEENEEYKCGELNIVKGETYDNYKASVASATSLDDDEYKKLSKQRARTDEQSFQVRKGQLERTYKVDVTPKLVEKDDQDWFRPIQLHYYFSHRNDYLKDREKNIMSNALEFGSGDYFIPDSNRSSLIAKINIMANLKVDDLLTTKFLSESHPLAIEIGKLARERMWALKDIGINLMDNKKSIKETTNMSICIKLIRLFNLKFPRIGRVRNAQGKQEWVHGLPAPNFEYVDEKCTKVRIDESGEPVAIPDGREDVFIAWDKKHIEEREKQERKLDKAKLQIEYNAALLREFQEGNYQKVSSLVQNLQSQREGFTDSIGADNYQIINEVVEEGWREIGKDVIAHQVFPEIYKELAVADAAKPQPEQKRPTSRQLSIPKLDKTYQEINHRRVEVKIKPEMPDITPENIVGLASDCESVEDAFKLVKAADEFNKLGECLYAIGDNFRRSILDTGKYLHAEIRKCYRSFYECFVDDIPMIEEF